MLISLPELRKKLEAQNKKVVLCHGVFDVLHLGHIHLLEKAKSYGDILVVSLSPDRYVKKGPNRPIFNQALRAKVVSALSVVDYVLVNDAPAALDILEAIQPDVYCKGESTSVCWRLTQEKEFVESYGGSVIYVDTLDESDGPLSSSRIINKLLPEHSNLLADAINKAKASISLEKLEDYFERISKLKIVVVGEYILDEYIIGRALARSSKEMVVPLAYKSKNLYLGGAAIIAANLSQFSDNVSLLTISDIDDIFIDMEMPSNVNLIKCPQVTIRKTRHVESGTRRKVAEMVYMDGGISDFCERELLSQLDELLPDCDIVICADYGYGLFTRRIQDKIEAESNFLTVMSQVNSANYGFSLITKWHSPDYVVMDEKELRLAAHDQSGVLEDILCNIAQELVTPLACVTMGHSGCIIRDSKDVYYTVPPFPCPVVDTMGAGDAFLAITTPFAHLGLPPNVIGLIGNAYGAMKVGIFGNEPVDPFEFNKFLRSLWA